jgi:hypothetical protein
MFKQMQARPSVDSSGTNLGSYAARRSAAWTVRV